MIMQNMFTHVQFTIRLTGSRRLLLNKATLVRRGYFQRMLKQRRVNMCKSCKFVLEWHRKETGLHEIVLNFRNNCLKQWMKNKRLNQGTGGCALCWGQKV